MKRIIAIALCAALLLGLCACSSGKGSTAVCANSAANTAEQELKIDVDLTKLSSTLVYAEVSNMMAEPSKYVGKAVRMSGPFATAKDDSTGKMYFACIIKDATACCSSGIEFELAGNYSYPNDYPAEGTEITVEGIFDTYLEGQALYCTLRQARML